MTDISDHEFSLLKKHLSRICGIDIPPEKRYLFKTRLNESFLGEEGMTFAELCKRLAAGKDKVLPRRLVQAMTTHESSFFRDGHPFDVFRDRILPDIAEQRLTSTKGSRPRIDILSSGCSAGQEPYSVAICVDEWLSTQKDFSASDVRICGTDISKPVLTQAVEGVYSDLEIGRFMPKDLLRRYFVRRDEKWEVSEEIRRMVSFREMNLAENFSHIGRFDVIFCRNVIIYFSAALKRRVITEFRRMLRPGGVLILGASETLYRLSKDFQTVHAGSTMYYVLKPGG